MNSRFQSWLTLTGTMLFVFGSIQAGDSGFHVLPTGTYFEPVLLDPVSGQLSGSLLAFNLDGKFQDKVYIPVNIGVRKMILRWEQDKDHGLEAGFEFAIFTQYEIHDEKRIVLGRMLNADYRISGLFHYRTGPNTYRLRLFHKSSHLGDDYMIDSNVTDRTVNPLNYEQFDITRSTSIGPHRYYFGLGLNVSPVTDRKRVAVQVGYLYRKSLGSRNIMNYLHGADVQIFEQNDYQPNIKLGIGLEIWPARLNPPRIVLEYFAGHLPYSRLEFQIVRLIGLGLYFNTTI